MPNTVKILEQPKHSTLLLTHRPATQGQDLTFEDFMQLCERLSAKYVRVATRKDGINIILGITKKKAYFGRAKTFAEAYAQILQRMHSDPTV